MNSDLVLRRHGLGEWRDRYSLEAARLLNRAGMQSREKFEHALPGAGMLDIVWDPARYAAAHVDRHMLSTAGPQLADLLEQASTELRRMSPAYAPLAEGLQEAAANLELPNPEDTAQAAPEQVENDTQSAPPAGTFKQILQSVGRFGRGAGRAVATASDSAGQTLRSLSGLHGRLRNAAATRVAGTWMGERGEPRPVLAQVLAIFDETARLARSMP